MNAENMQCMTATAAVQEMAEKTSTKNVDEVPTAVIYDA